MSINNLYTERPACRGVVFRYPIHIMQSTEWRAMSQIYHEYVEQGPMSNKGFFIDYLCEQMPEFANYMNEQYSDVDLSESTMSTVFNYVKQFIEFKDV